MSIVAYTAGYCVSHVAALQIEPETTYSNQHFAKKTEMIEYAVSGMNQAATDNAITYHPSVFPLAKSNLVMQNRAAPQPTITPPMTTCARETYLNCSRPKALICSGDAYTKRENPCRGNPSATLSAKPNAMTPAATVRWCGVEKEDGNLYLEIVKGRANWMTLPLTYLLPPDGERVL